MVTIDITVSRLVYFLDQYEYEGFEDIYLSGDEGKLLYSHFKAGKKKLPTGDNISSYLEISKNNPFLVTAESADVPFTLLGTVDIGALRRELKNTRISLMVSLLLWVPFFIWYSALSAHSRQSRRNRSLSRENVALKDEIELRKKTEVQLQFLAFHDPVTGLENLRSLKENVPPSQGQEGSEAAYADFSG